MPDAERLRLADMGAAGARRRAPQQAAAGDGNGGRESAYSTAAGTRVEEMRRARGAERYNAG